MGQVEPDYIELFALELGKIVEYDFVCTRSSKNIDQSAPNLVKMYETMVKMYKISDEFDYGSKWTRTV